MDLAVTFQAAGTAVALGITHAVEPDHVAGISALTGEARDARRSAVVGGLFAVGHAVLVLAWVALWYALGGLPVPDAMGSVGMIVVGLLLSALAVALGVTGLQRFAHRHEHNHGTHSHLHVHLPFVNLDSHRHDHTLRGYLATGIVGALFTLSPPLSMLGFISIVLPTTTGSAVTIVLGAYAVGIVATMSFVGSSVGSISRFTQRYGARTHAAFEIGTAILVFAYGLSVLRSHLDLPVLF